MGHGDDGRRRAGRGQERRQGRDDHHHLDGSRRRSSGCRRWPRRCASCTKPTCPDGLVWHCRCTTELREDSHGHDASGCVSGKGKIGIREVPRPEPGVGEALVKVTLTTICGTDVHILKGEYPGARGPDRRPRARRRDRGARARASTGYAPGDRVIVGAITPCGQCRACLSGDARRSAATAATATRRSAAGGSATPSTAARPSTSSCPNAQANLAKIPGRARRRRGAALPRHHVDRLLGRRARPRAARRCGRRLRAGADRPVRDRGRAPGRRVAGHRRRQRPAAPGVRAADGRRRRPQLQGAGRRRRDQAADRAAAPTSPSRRSGTQATFENCLRSVRPGGTVSSLGVYSGHLTVPLDAFAAGLGDHTIVTSLCPGGKERMRRLMSIVAAKRFPFRELVTHPFRLGRHRGRLRPLRAPARRRHEGRDPPVTT